MAAEKSYFVTSLECEADSRSAEGSASVKAPCPDGTIAHLLSALLSRSPGALQSRQSSVAQSSPPCHTNVTSKVAGQQQRAVPSRARRLAPPLRLAPSRSRTSHPTADEGFRACLGAWQKGRQGSPHRPKCHRPLAALKSQNAPCSCLTGPNRLSDVRS